MDEWSIETVEMPWQRALYAVLKTIYAPLESDRVQWAVIGSVASALQGCSFLPGDIDLIAYAPEGIHRIAQLMRAYAPEKAPFLLDSPDWLSSHELPVSVSPPDPFGFVWHFARWQIQGVKVEAAHIKAPEDFAWSWQGAGIWEAGPEIWPHLRTVGFAGYQVPVVPLEIQLQTNRVRRLTDRLREIESLLREQGCDRGLLKTSLAGEYREEFRGLWSEGPDTV